MQTYLIDEYYLKQYSLFPKNYDLSEIMNFVPLAEQLHIVPIIGDSLYMELINQIKDDTLTELNSKLLLQIYPLEGLCVVEVSMPYIAMHISEVGITKGKSDNSDSVDVSDINYLTNYVRSQIEPLKNKLIAYLNEHSDEYPLYKKPKCTIKDDTSRIYSFKQINTDISEGNPYSLKGGLREKEIWSL